MAGYSFLSTILWISRNHSLQGYDFLVYYGKENINLNINQIKYSEKFQKRLKEGNLEEDHLKMIKEFENKINISEEIESWISRQERIEWDIYEERISGLKYKRGLKFVNLLFNFSGRFLRIKCNISFNLKYRYVEMYIWSSSIFRTFGKNGVMVKIKNQFVDFKEFEQQIIKITENENFILVIKDTTNIIKAIELYKRIDDFRQNRQSAFIPVGNFEISDVHNVDLKLISDEKVEKIKGKNFTFVKTDEIEKLPKDSYSSTLKMLKSKKEIGNLNLLTKTLRGIMRNDNKLICSLEASRNNNLHFVKLTDYAIKITGKDKGILTLFIEENEDELQVNYYFCIYDRLSYIKSQTMFSVIEDVKKHKINNNNLFEYLFNNGLLNNVGKIVDWQFNQNLFNKISQGLNQEQKHAFQMATDDFPITFIQGPPGTGKTFTITRICKYYADLGMKVLVSSQTNVAVENILENLADDLAFDSLFVKAESGRSDFSLFNIKKIYEEKIANMLKLQTIDLENITLTDLLLKTKIVGSTTTSSSLNNRIWNDFSKKIDVLIVDEISKSSVPELIRYVVNAKKIIFVGDQRQLAPLGEFLDDDYIWDSFSDEDKEIIKQYISVSIFDKLFENMKNYNRAITLQENHRSVQSLLDVYSIFYNNNLIANRTDRDSRIKWRDNIKPLYPFTFMAMNNSREQMVGTSRRNVLEAEFIDELLSYLSQNIINTKKLTIAVIATYGAQVKQIRQSVAINKYRNLNFKELKINTVDAFQGEQADIVIISTVLANSKNPQGFGFISDYRRLNVAISRAKDLAIVLGNDSILRNIPMRYDQKNRLFFDEIFHSLQKKQTTNYQNNIQRKQVI